jgi:hypothetical protein
MASAILTWNANTEPRAYTHAGAYLTARPTGRIVVCEIKDAR